MRISDWSSDVCSSDLEAWPDKPRLLLGHSMGGLIAALLLIERQGDFAAAALSGPAIQTPAPPSKPMLWLSRLLSSYFPRAGVLALDSTGVSRDPAVVAAYSADPLASTGKLSARLAAQMFAALRSARAAAGGRSLPLPNNHDAADS